MPTLIKHVLVPNLMSLNFIWRSTNVVLKKKRGGGHISLRWSRSCIRSPQIVAIYHETWICYGHSLLPLLQDWQLQVSCRRVFNVLVNRLLYKHAPSFFIGAIHKKMLFPIPFRIDPTRKAIAVNSLLSQLRLAPLKPAVLETYPAFIRVQMNIVMLFSYSIIH